MLFVAGCATQAPQKFSDFREGEWHAKVLVHDKKAEHSGIVNVDIKAVNNERLRLDITSTMGSYIATLVLNNSKLDYVNAADRTIYHSKSNREAVQAILKVPVEMSLFFNVLFDQLPVGKNWQCESDSNGLPKLCRDSKTNVSVAWTRREGESRTVEIDHPSAQLQMNLFDFVNHISDGDKAFEVKVPGSFKVKNLGYGRTSRSETFGRN